jgi:hypothetical protein
LYLFLIRQEPLNALTAFHSLEMSLTVRKLREIEIELRPATKAPEEMRVRGGEMVKEIFASRQHVIGNLVIFQEWANGQSSHTVAGIGQVADARRRVDPG